MRPLWGWFSETLTTWTFQAEILWDLHQPSRTTTSLQTPHTSLKSPSSEGALAGSLSGHPVLWPTTGHDAPYLKPHRGYLLLLQQFQASQHDACGPDEWPSPTERTVSSDPGDEHCLHLLGLRALPTPAFASATLLPGMPSAWQTPFKMESQQRDPEDAP